MQALNIRKRGQATNIFFISKMKNLMVYTIKFINYFIDFLTINNNFFNISI